MGLSVRNSDGIWVNTECFRESALHYKKYRYYCADPFGSPNWYSYWKEERRRCIEGYSVGGVRITGEHYFYLNYCPIRLVEHTKSKTARKVTSFPHFWDGDYNFFWSRHISRYGLGDSGSTDSELLEELGGLGLFVDIEAKYLRGGYNFIIGKARRKGFSYKNASIAVNNFLTKEKSLTILNAYDKAYLTKATSIFPMAVNYINFINENTGWVVPSDKKNKVDSIRSSYIVYNKGVQVEKGFKSEIIAVSCKDNPEPNKGKDAEDIFIEEAGVFGSPGLLKELYASSVDCVSAGGGNIQTGMITIFGTAGDMEGSSADYAEMFNRPDIFNLLPFKNKWTKELIETKCGYFHPVSLNKEGYYDEQGNSDIKGAEAHALKQIALLEKNGATFSQIMREKQNNPIYTEDAFSIASTNNFPVVELNRQLQKVKAYKWQEKKGTPVMFYKEGGTVMCKPILSSEASPITTLFHNSLHRVGCPVIYEFPVSNSPRGLYKIGYDPIRQDEGTSLAGIVVYKGVHRESLYHSIIVAEYIGRMESAEDIDRLAEYFADLYNAQIMHENEVTGVTNYFKRHRRLDLLASQPDCVISKNIKRSRVARVYGCHMSIQLKDAGERYVKDWLLNVIDHDEDGNAIRVLDKIYSIRLLEELISYNRKGNFDLVSALFMCMFQIQEEQLGKEYSYKDNNKKMKKLSNMIKYMYSNK